MYKLRINPRHQAECYRLISAWQASGYLEGTDGLTAEQIELLATISDRGSIKISNDPYTDLVKLHVIDCGVELPVSRLQFEQLKRFLEIK